MAYNPLTPQEEKIIVQKGTEYPGTGEYDDFYLEGTYICRRCNAPLYTSDAKYNARCGWPAFEQEIKGAVKNMPGPDPRWREIECTHCSAHLGHVFYGEHLTDTDTRHCVNSLSMRFIPHNKDLPAVKDEA